MKMKKKEWIMEGKKEKERERGGERGKDSASDSLNYLSSDHFAG